MNKLFFFKESIAFATNALRANKLRTFLSLVGVCFGIFSIISVFTMVDTLEDSVKSGVESLGEEAIFIQKWPWGGGGDYPWWKYYNRPEPSPKEFKQLAGRLYGASAIVFMSGGKRTVAYKDEKLTETNILVHSSQLQDIYTLEIAAGRYPTEKEFASGREVTVLGSKISSTLFGSPEIALYKTIKIDGRKTQVIGVLEEEGTSVIGDSNDEKVLIPLNFGRKFIDVKKEGPTIVVKPVEGIKNDELKDRLRGVMRGIRKLRPKEDDDFALNEPSVLNSQLEGLFGTINIVGVIIGMFSILVGGFSISNIMFVSVKERIQQIGVQKALGAKQNFILMQFLIEAVFLSVLGGILGLVIVFLLASVFSVVADMEIFLSLKNVGIGVGISMVVGIVSGIVPAYNASKLDPVEAIRSS